MNAQAEPVPQDAEFETKEEEAPPKRLSRDEIRATVLGKRQEPKYEVVSLFGTDIELRQPAFGDMLDAREIGDTKTRTIELIIQYAYVPGTDERIFEDTDRDVILDWPFGEDLVEVQSAIARLSGIDIEALEEKLTHDPLPEQ